MSKFPFDSVRNAREAGFENVPDYLVTDGDAAGSTDRPGLEDYGQPNKVLTMLKTHPWMWIVIALGALWLCRKVR